jgi:hypothetical protein
MRKLLLAAAFAVATWPAARRQLIAGYFTGRAHTHGHRSHDNASQNTAA